jgi:hypothetical protein
MTAAVARRMFELLEPIELVTFFADEPAAELVALGLRDNHWDGYFASRSAPLGQVPPEVVHALFYNFAEGEVARHLPRVWDVVTPQAALDARLRGCVAALRRILGEQAEDPRVESAADLVTKAAYGAPTEGRALYAAYRTLPVPDDPLARLWHSGNLLREHRGDGHVASLLGEGVSGAEAHMLHGLSEGTPARKFGRVHHLPEARLDSVVRGLQARGLLDDAEQLTDEGRAIKARIETRTDELAAPAYDVLSPAEQDQLESDLAPITARLVAAGSR